MIQIAHNLCLCKEKKISKSTQSSMLFNQAEKKPARTTGCFFVADLLGSFLLLPLSEAGPLRI